MEDTIKPTKEERYGFYGKIRRKYNDIQLSIATELSFVCPLKQPKKSTFVKNVVWIESFIKITPNVFT